MKSHLQDSLKRHVPVPPKKRFVISQGGARVPKSFADVQATRWERLFDTIQPITFGSVWWVPEPLWIKHIPGYGRNSMRPEHPGLALLRRFHVGLDHIPMVHGTTWREYRHGHGEDLLKVKGLTSDDPEHCTVFGELLAPMPPRAWYTLPKIRRNNHKPVLSGTEMQDFEAVARRRGWVA